MNQPQLDLVSIGECLVEFSRVDAVTFRQAYAGDAFNTLFYAGRLGLRTGFVSAVGDDLFSEMILAAIEKEKIDRTCLLQLAGRRNGLYFIELDSDGECSFHFWRSESAATRTLLQLDPEVLARYISSSRYFLFTGVGLAILRDPERLLNLLQQVAGHTVIAFDTNYRSRLWSSADDYRSSFEAVLPYIDILLPSSADLEALYPGRNPSELCRELGNRGVKTIALKASEQGAALWMDDRLEWSRTERSIPLVDATGAGDAFNGGFLAALAQGKSEWESLLRGKAVAEHVVGIRGAIDPRFSLDDLH